MQTKQKSFIANLPSIHTEVIIPSSSQTNQAPHNKQQDISTLELLTQETIVDLGNLTIILRQLPRNAIKLSYHRDCDCNLMPTTLFTLRKSFHPITNLENPINISHVILRQHMNQLF